MSVGEPQGIVLYKSRKVLTVTYCGESAVGEVKSVLNQVGEEVFVPCTNTL